MIFAAPSNLVVLKFNRLVAFIVPVIIALFSAERAATAAPAFPLFFIDARDDSSLPDLSPSDIEVLATNFVFGHFGMQGCSSEVVRAFHTLNPRFIALRYVSHQRTDYTLKPFNAESHRMDLLYYRCAALSAPIAKETTEFNLNEVGGPIALKASTSQADSTDSIDPTHKFATWIRIENELLRLEGWDPLTKTARVKRGFDGTTAMAYPARANVLAPVATSSFSRRSAAVDAKELTVRYSYDPARARRWELSLQSALENQKDGFDGTWYDLISATPFRPADINQSPLNNVWDCVRQHNYTPDDYRLACEKGLHYVMTNYFASQGRWPIIFINNMKRTEYYPGKGAIQNFLKSTPEKPRPVDGYCVEAFGGSISGEDFLQSVKTRTTVRLNYLGGEIWKSKVSVVMDAAQNGLAAVPYNAMAGRENRAFEHLDAQARNHFDLWAYATYLMAVERKNGKCPTVFGINPFYWEGNQRKAILNSRYTWDLGEPAESHSPDHLNQYKSASHETYVRKFQKGIVLVNPSTTRDAGVTLGRQYIDPETEEKVTAVSLAPQTGRILLIP